MDEHFMSQKRCSATPRRPSGEQMVLRKREEPPSGARRAEKGHLRQFFFFFNMWIQGRRALKDRHRKGLLD